VSLFSDPEIIALLKDQFIPAAVDNHHIEKQKDAEGDFYRSVASHQGEYVCTAEGKLLASTNTHSASHLKGLMMKALKDFQPPAAGAAAAGGPDARFHKTLQAGGLVVKVTTKVLGGYGPTEDFWTRTLQETLGRNRLWIWKDEADELGRGRIPEAVLRRLARFCLTDNTRGSAATWKPEDVRKLQLTLEGGRLSGSVRLESASGARGFEGRLSGFVEVRDGRVSRFDAVASGSCWSDDPLAPKGKYPFAAAFTLAPRDAREDVPPLGVREIEDYTR